MAIATIELVSDLYTSVWGDERLFFSHYDTGKDRDIWPFGWLRFDSENDPRVPDAPMGTFDNLPSDRWPSDDDEAKLFFMEQEEQHGCPFYWIVEWLDAGSP